MRVVVDTNVIISGTFFGGKPGAVVDAIADGRVDASAPSSILREYHEVIEEVIRKGYGHFDASRFGSFVAKLELREPERNVEVCRDPDDDKFISCALGAKAVFIVSGDKDLLDIGSYEGVDIVTAAEFCGRYL